MLQIFPLFGCLGSSLIDVASEQVRSNQPGRFIAVQAEHRNGKRLARSALVRILWLHSEMLG